MGVWRGGVLPPSADPAWDVIITDPPRASNQAANQPLLSAITKMEAYQRERNKKTQQYLPFSLKRNTSVMKEINEKLLSELQFPCPWNQHVSENLWSKYFFQRAESENWNFNQKKNISNTWNPKLLLGSIYWISKNTYDIHKHMNRLCKLY